MTGAAPPEEYRAPAAPEPPLSVVVRQRHSTLRMVVGIIGLLLILGAGVERCTTATLDRSASAVQITQIYTEGVFFVVVITGALVALYVAMRPD